MLALPIARQPSRLSITSTFRRGFIFPGLEHDRVPRPYGQEMPDPQDDDSSSTANNALQIAGSIVSILTFVYALGVGLYLYAKTAASSPQEINEFIISLQFSYEEMQRFAHTLVNYERERIDAASASRPGQPSQPTTAATSEPPDPEAQALAAKAYLIEGHTASRLESLRRLALKVGTMANDGFFRQWSNRVRYVLLQEELAKQVAGKDRLMEELRRVQER